MAGQNKTPDVTVIKKYANRRLYDTSRSSYITLEDLQAMLKRGEDFVVYDAKSGDDITRSVLTQIIVDEETSGESLLPLDFLKSIIKFYGQNMNGVLPQYLEHSMQNFTDNQEQIRKYFANAFQDFFDISNLEKISRQNIEMFEKTMGIMSPFQGDKPKSTQKSGANEATTDKTDVMAEQIERLQRELNELKKNSK